MIEAEAHPRLSYRAFVTEYPFPLGSVVTPDWLRALLSLAVTAPVKRDEALRSAVRDMLRHGGYKPTGRGKPASEYLVRAAERGDLTGINGAVDACNAVSLHSGFPISVIDLDRATPPFRIAVGLPGEGYGFNASDQRIEVSGLVCLYDAIGPCANAVKDSERTKTSDATVRTLSVVWGVAGYEERLAAVASWYREVLERLGARTDPEWGSSAG